MLPEVGIHVNPLHHFAVSRARVHRGTIALRQFGASVCSYLKLFHWCKVTKKQRLTQMFLSL